jgi:PAS domain S-box-containing protein
MLLRNKSLAVIVIALIILVMMVYFASQVILMGSYANLEDNSTRSTVDTALREINYDTSSLLIAGNDYATWDDTYAFIEDGNSGYIDSNMGNNTLQNLRINVILYLNASGGLVYGKSLDLETGQEIPMLPGLIDNVQAGSPLLNTQGRSSVNGVLMLPANPLLVAACPILMSDGSGTPRGTLVMGRYLGKDEIASLSDIGGVDMVVEQYNEPNMPSDFADALSMLASEDIVVRPIDGDTISGYGLIRDVYGDPALIIRVDLPRLVYLQGQSSVGYFMLALVLSGLAMSLVAIFVMQRTAIGRISRLSESVRRIGADNDLTMRLPEGGDDEVAGFARTMNATLDSLEHYRQSLRSSEHRFRTLVENINEVVWETDGDLKLTYVGPRARDVIGYRPEQLLGRSPFELIKPGDREQIRSIINEMIVRKGAFANIEISIARPDGIMVDAEIGGNPVRDPAGKIVGYSGIVRDIGERKQSEEALRESEERFKQVAENANEWIWEVDVDGMYTYTSPIIEKVLGYRPEEVIGKMHFYDFFAPDARGELKDVAFGIFATKASFNHFVNPNLHRNGNLVTLETSGAPILDKQGRLTGYRGVGTDITERKRSEDQIRASLAEKDVLLKEIHHRVKNNLQIISSLLSLQLDNINSENPAITFKESQDRIRSMALIHEKLYRSKDISHIDFAEYVHSLTAYLSHSYVTGRGITFAIDIEGISLCIDTAIPCGLIINELVTNSLKYAFRNSGTGEICIGLTWSDGRYVLTVSDNGVGLPPGLDFRNTTSLGLQLVNTLVYQLEGTIELDSSRGTAFKIVFSENKPGSVQNAAL